MWDHKVGCLCSASHCELPIAACRTPHLLGTVQGAQGYELALPSLEVEDGVSKTGGQRLLLLSSPSGFMSPGTWVLGQGCSLVGIHSPLQWT